jgi:hypothetical protein
MGAFVIFTIASLLVRVTYTQQGLLAPRALLRYLATTDPAESVRRFPGVAGYTARSSTGRGRLLQLLGMTLSPCCPYQPRRSVSPPNVIAHQMGTGLQADSGDVSLVRPEETSPTANSRWPSTVPHTIPFPRGSAASGQSGCICCLPPSDPGDTGHLLESI